MNRERQLCTPVVFASTRRPATSNSAPVVSRRPFEVLVRWPLYDEVATVGSCGQQRPRPHRPGAMLREHSQDVG